MSPASNQVAIIPIKPISEWVGCYALFGLPITATMAVVKGAYRSMARALHPDKASKNEVDQETATANFQRLLNAYHVLEEREEEKEDEKREWLASCRTKIDDAREQMVEDLTEELEPLAGRRERAIADATSAFGGWRAINAFYHGTTDTDHRRAAANFLGLP